MEGDEVGGAVESPTGAGTPVFLGRPRGRPAGVALLTTTGGAHRMTANRSKPLYITAH